VLSRGAGVPDSLRPAVLLTPETNDLFVGHEGEPRRPEPSPLSVPWQTGLAALLVIAVVVVTSLGADGAYRADHDYWAAHTSLTEAPATGTSQAHTEVGPKFFPDLQHAAALNPWEPIYPAFEGTVYEEFATSASSASSTSGVQTVLTDLVQSRRLFAEALAREPIDPQDLVNEADVDGYLSEVQPTEAHSDLIAAAALARRAISEDPLDSEYRAFLKQVLAAEHPKVAKKPVPKRS